MTRLDRLLEHRHTLTPFVGVGATVAAVPNESVASWQGLLEAGLNACQQLQPQLPDDWSEQTRARLRSGDVLTYLAVADEISRRLVHCGEWDSWIGQTVGRLVAPSSPLHAAICKLNRVLLTTNYDLLLEAASPAHETLSWDNPTDLALLVGGDARAVVHLHGVVSRPKTIVLGSWQYQGLLDRESAQFWQKVLVGSRRLLFIGCGAGLTDPNIGPALEFMRSLGSAGVPPLEHFLLVRGGDLAAVLSRPPGAGVVPVAYGAEYSDLVPFLESLTAGGTPTPSQDPRDYVVQPRSSPKQALLDLAGPAEDAVVEALNEARRALQAQGQVERRTQLPQGSATWGLADQLSVHERTASSALAPSQRLWHQSTILSVAMQAADAPVGLLANMRSGLLSDLFQMIEELDALCEQLALRVSETVARLEAYSTLTDDYRPALDLLRQALESVDEVRATSRAMLPS